MKRGRIELLLAVTITGFFSGCVLFTPAPGPVHLTCEYQMNPHPLDVLPRFSWWLNDSRRGARQSAYRILVASSPEKLAAGEGDLWDTGKVESDDSTLIPYGGKTLLSRQQCWWKVMTWDANGKASGWSNPATFEMALLNKSDWKARWISPNRKEVLSEPIPLSPWYWHPTIKGKSTVFFRTEIELPADPVPHFTKIAISADDSYELFVNGRPVGNDGNFKSVEVYSERPCKLNAGKNVIAVKVKNADGPAGFTLGIYQSFFGGTHKIILPDKWVCSGKGAKNWNRTKGFLETKAWVPAKVAGQQGDEPWGALTQPLDGPRRAVMIRHEFRLPAKPVRARAYVTALGFYELRLNGKKVGKDIFTPGWTQYEKRIQYQVYDITRQLKAGENAVGALLGNGWWAGGLGWSGGKRYAKPGEDLRLLAQLEIECADGSVHTIASNPSWRWKEAPILEDTLYNGETYDARLEENGWDQPGFIEKGWKQLAPVNESMDKLCAQRGPTIQVTKELKPVEIRMLPDGSYLLDFGQNHAGRPRLKVKAPAGTKIQMIHGEFLKEDGTLERANYRSARATDTYICKGEGTEVWEPRFTYRGFRYMQVIGLPTRPSADTIVSHVLHTAPPLTGTFECSNSLLERLREMTLWGQRSNMQSVPTDCPQRDERLGWMGDAQAFAPMSIWNMDMALFYTKWMRDIRQAQQPDGSVPGVCPTVGDWVIGPGRSAWADAITILPWDVYLYYGDKQILEENYGAIKKWVEFMRGKFSEDGLYEQPTWGDWVPVVKTPNEPVSALFGYYSTKLLSKMAEITGRDADAKAYKELAEQQRNAFNRKYLNRDNSYSVGTQTANILPLAFGMVDKNRQQAVADHIAADVRKNGGHLTTGFLGTPYILPVLSQYGYPDLAYGILNTREYPSLGYMLANGATTVWERWNSDKEPPAGMNSRNHFAFGSLCQWLFEGLAGIKPDPRNPGFKHIIIKPYFMDDLNFVKARYPTMYGEVAIEWRQKDREIVLELQVPPNTTATVCLPALNPEQVRESGKSIANAEGVSFAGMKDGRAMIETGAGKYRFTVKR